MHIQFSGLQWSSHLPDLNHQHGLVSGWFCVEAVKVHKETLTSIISGNIKPKQTRRSEENLKAWPE